MSRGSLWQLRFGSLSIVVACRLQCMPFSSVAGVMGFAKALWFAVVAWELRVQTFRLVLGRVRACSVATVGRLMPCLAGPGGRWVRRDSS